MKLLLSALVLAVCSLSAHAEKVNVAIKGMHCADCAASIQEKFKAMPEVKNVNVSYKKKSMQPETAGKGEITDEKIKSEVKAAGYDVQKIVRTN